MPLPSLVLAALIAAAGPPLRLHPENPRYFEFRGKTTILVTSAEHYGAVLNLDFDFLPYLDELQSRGFNQTRTFSGTYRELPGSFKIEGNTLAPAKDRYCSPWVLRDGRYDLDTINEAYLTRLKAFLAAAGKRGVVVEYVLFCPFYEENLWVANPMNARNNVNGIGRCPREEVYTLKHPDLLRRQLAFVKRVVAELNGFDNLYYEICNEPYFGGVTLEWQKTISDAIVETEKALPRKHLIAQNIANGSAKIERPDPNVSIFNFHYASPPTAIAANWSLARPITFDETGFKGTGDAVYRRQAWAFLLSGGAGFSNLDYSFTAAHPNGSALVRDPTPGGGGPALRKQLSLLKTFLDGFDLARMAPDRAFLGDSAAGKARTIFGLANPRGGEYALYAESGQKLALTLKLPPRKFRIEWIDPRDGKVLGTAEIQGPVAKVESPPFTEDIAARIVTPD